MPGKELWFLTICAAAAGVVSDAGCCDRKKVETNSTAEAECSLAAADLASAKRELATSQQRLAVMEVEMELQRGVLNASLEEIRRLKQTPPRADDHLVQKSDPQAPFRAQVARMDAFMDENPTYEKVLEMIGGVSAVDAHKTYIGGRALGPVAGGDKMKQGMDQFLDTLRDRELTQEQIGLMAQMGSAAPLGEMMLIGARYKDYQDVLGARARRGGTRARMAGQTILNDLRGTAGAASFREQFKNLRKIGVKDLGFGAAMISDAMAELAPGAPEVQRDRAAQVTMLLAAGLKTTERDMDFLAQYAAKYAVGPVQVK